MLVLLLAMQQAPSPPPLPTSPIARVEVTPAEVAVEVGDTLRLKAAAFDSAGRPVTDVTVR